MGVNIDVTQTFAADHIRNTTSMHSPQAPAARLTAWFMRRTAPNAVRRIAPLNAAVASDVGVAREENQDRVAIVRSTDRAGGPVIIAALADGIGGMRQGSECAAMALAHFLDCVISEAQHSKEPADWLRKGALRANRAVHARFAGQGGSTLAAIVMAKGHRPIWLSVGDSRVYHAADGKLTQLSKDDTLEGQLGKLPNGGRRPDLLQFIGLGDGLEPHVESTPWDLTGTLLLTTDGVHFVDSDHLGRLAEFAPDLGQCARRFTETARWLGGPDNASVAAIAVDALTADPHAHLEGGFEVWDSFGEVQVIFDQGARRYPSTAPSADDAPPAEAPVRPRRDLSARNDSPSQKAVPPPSNLVNASGKSKVSKARGRTRVKKPKEATPQDGDEDSNQVPQLLIEFPNKTS